MQHVTCTGAMVNLQRSLATQGSLEVPQLQSEISLKREGMLRVSFAGYGSFLLRDLPFDAIEFVAYEQLKSMYKVSLICFTSTVERLCHAWTHQMPFLE